MFKAENPQVFAKRVAEAYMHRKKTEGLLRLVFIAFRMGLWDFHDVSIFIIFLVMKKQNSISIFIEKIQVILANNFYHN